MSREYLTLEELLRALATVSARNLDTVVTLHSYRTHTGDPFPPGGKSAWDGPLASEIRASLAVTEDYVASAEVEALLRDLRSVGLEAWFSAGGYEDGYLHVGVGEQGKRRAETQG